MAADEDTELRDLVAQTLEANGVLGKIRAQVRSSVFLALEEHDSLQDKPMFVNKELKAFLNTKDGQQATGLVRELLEYFKMEFTLAVFDPESGCEKRSRKSIAHDCGLSDSGDKPGKGPLLLELLKSRQKSTADDAGDSGDYLKVARDVSDKEIAKAKAKFQHYDLDHDGFISRDELDHVFKDLLPNFPASMVDGYLKEDCGKGDEDMTGCNEFIKIYKQLLHFCRAAVSDQATPIQPTSSQIEKTPFGDSTLERKNKKNKSETSEKSSKHQNGIEYEDSEPEEDPFFDDPAPKNDKHQLQSKSKGAKSNDLNADLDKDIKAIDKKIADLGFDVGDDDYDDDFATNSNISNKMSARTADNKSPSIGEEIDESIEEALSGDEDDMDDTTDQTVSINEVSGFDYVEDVSAALP